MMPMDESLVSLLRRAPGYRDQIAHVEHLPPRPARYAEPAEPLPPILRAALAVHGIEQLYTHQAAALDGDTPHAARDRIRADSGIILSNPDMLHRSLLPDHRRWASWLAWLRFIVLDEAHIYRGVFGTHVALIMRRLLRLCAHYGSA